MKKEIKYMNDVVIKKALANESEVVKNYIARLISHVTNLPKEDLKNNLELVYSEIGSNANIVNSFADVCFTNKERYFGIEINYSRSSTSVIKSLTYAYQLTLRQLTNSTKYKDLKPITLININLIDIYGKGELVHRASMKDDKYNIDIYKKIEIYDISLSYFKKIDYTNIKEGSLEKDLAFLVIEDDELFNKLYEGDSEVNMMKLNMDQFRKDFDLAFYCSEEELQKQIEEEMTEKGREEGLKQGLKEGEKNKSIAIAKKMLKENMSIELISNITDLSIEEIENLKK